MSSAVLQEFQQGEPLTAAALNALASRIRALQQREAQSGQLVYRPRRVLPGRHFAFQLAELNGCIWYRQGWLDVAGKLVPVGDKEWNLLGGMKPCTVWLNITRGEAGAVSGTVEQGELDLETPETNLRRRLGYVRTEEAQDEYGLIWHAVQVLGGVISPVAPRRQMGAPAMPPIDADSASKAGLSVALTSQNATSKITVPMTLNDRCTSAVRFAFLLVPNEDKIAVIQVPMF